MDAQSGLSWLREVKPISRYQFGAFRVTLGAYLFVHFAQLIPYAAELFSADGVLPDPRANFTHGLLPSPLEFFASPTAAIAFISVLAAISICFTLNFQRRIAAVLLWYGLACLFNRNNLIANPSLPYIGMLLLLTAFVPDDEPWFFPAWAFRSAWILLAAGYTLSGIDKLLHSPSWSDGTALVHVLNLPLARPGLLRDALLTLPAWMMNAATCVVLGLEVGAVPLCFFRKTRRWYWLAMAAMHVGIMFVIDFADLSFGMLLLHFFTFDPEWLPPAKSFHALPVVLFDGACGMCNRTVQILKSEDHARVLTFIPRESSAAATLRAQHPELDWDVDSLLYFRSNGAGVILLNRSAAVLTALSDIGGFWRIVSLSRIVPRRLRDAVYDFVASRRGNRGAVACAWNEGASLERQKHNGAKSVISSRH